MYWNNQLTKGIKMKTVKDGVTHVEKFLGDVMADYADEGVEESELDTIMSEEIWTLACDYSEGDTDLAEKIKSSLEG